MRIPKKYKKFYRPIFFILIMTCFLGLGFFYGVQSWNKQLYVQIHPLKSRGLAGVQQESSLYSIPLSEINEEIQNKLFKQTKTVKKDSLLGFYLGNFLVPDTEEKGHQFVCQFYSYLEASFVALDVTLNGEDGLMVVQSPCNREDDLYVGPVWLPVEEMHKNLGQRAFNLEEAETLIRFYNISFSLASHWLLKSVRFFNSPEDEGLVVNYEPNQDLSFQLEFDYE